METFEKLLDKSREWRDWYYDGEPGLNEVAKSVEDAFDLINATLFGHIYQRPGLDTRTRSLCTIAALTVLGKDGQLGGHVTGALNCGVSKEEIIELIVQLLFYGGYPCTVNALAAAAKTFGEYDEKHGGS